MVIKPTTTPSSRTQVIADLRAVLRDLALLADGATSRHGDAPVMTTLKPGSTPPSDDSRHALSVAYTRRLNRLLVEGERRRRSGAVADTMTRAALLAADDASAAELARFVQDARRDVDAFRLGERRAEDLHGPRDDSEAALRAELAAHPRRTARGARDAMVADERGAVAILERERAAAGLSFRRLAQLTATDLPDTTEDAVFDGLRHFVNGRRGIAHGTWAAAVVAAHRSTKRTAT